ncbi:hypothetical protein [uncultured Albimonas sp.]|uniref:hypothetical protein n=1 Tax=uncultured Albimonas sp. TaxID=1331701 RepID=UPI0030EE81CD
MKAARRSAAIGEIAFAVTASAAAQASPVELRYASGSGPNTIGAFATDIFQKNVEDYSDGAVTSKTCALSLPNLLEMTGGVREGIADLGVIAQSYRERFGIEDASARLDRLRELMGEWTPRMEGVSDGEGLSVALWEHVHSRVDVMAYRG